MNQNVEDVYENEFLITLQNKFPSLYQQAQESCWLICVPQSNALEGFKYTKENIGFFFK